MEKLVTSSFKLGIIAGGQLAKMLIQEASKWNVITYVLDPDENGPASTLASKFIRGSNTDYESVYRFGKMVDMLTFEIENIHMGALQQLKAEGLRIVPDPDILELIQDKGRQKDFYERNGIPTAPFRLFDSRQAIRQALESGDISYPFVQKLRQGGYDGRGVAVIDGRDDLVKMLDGPSVVEEKIRVSKEIAVITARNGRGETASFPVVEMVFDPEANLVDKLICPSALSQKQSEQATRMAEQIIQGLDMQGLLAVEFFIDEQGQVLVNEMAPRTHNSGHHTIESMVTSQFEQHLRAVFNLPLGCTRLKLPSVMINILGDPGYEGRVRYEGLTDIMAIEGVKVHLYGKPITRPFRKMGHITIMAGTLAEALDRAEQVKQLIHVKSWE